MHAALTAYAALCTDFVSMYFRRLNLPFSNPHVCSMTTRALERVF